MQGVEATTTGKTFVNCQMENWLEEQVRLEAAKKKWSKGELIRRAIMAYLGLDQLNETAEAGRGLSN